MWLFVSMHTPLEFQCSSVQALGGYVVEHRRQERGARVVRGARGRWHGHTDASDLVRGACSGGEGAHPGESTLWGPNMWGEGRGERCNQNGRRPTALLSDSRTPAARFTHSLLYIPFTAESATTTISTCTRSQ